MAGANSVRSILYALGANLSLAVAKFVAAGITGSSAMLAEAIHSLADTGNQVLLLFGLKQTRQPPTEAHPLGFGKSIYFWSFLVAIILFTVGGLFSVYEGVHKLQHPEPLSSAWVAIAVLVFGITVEGISFRACLQEVAKEQHGRGLIQWFRESRTSELIVIFGEDLAALLGLIFALVAVTVTMMTGNPIFDAIGTLMIGALLLVVAWFIAVEVKDLLIGQSVEPAIRRDMHAFLDARPEIEEVYRLVTLQLGPDAMVAIKARLRRQFSGEAQVTDINQVERDFRAAFPLVTWLFFEPDLTDD